MRILKNVTMQEQNALRTNAEKRDPRVGLSGLAVSDDKLLGKF